MNPANGLSTSFPSASQGNSFPMFGTGQVIYTQVGYLMKKDLLGEGNGTLMPYASLMRAKYDRLNNQMNVYNVGLNWLMKGHMSKLTLDYQLRPVYEQQSTELVKTSTRGQAVLQYQLFF